MRITEAVKSGVCKASIWSFESDTHVLSVPVCEETQELRTALLKHREPMAEYREAKTGKLLKLQWQLFNGEDRALIQLAKQSAKVLK